MKITHLDAQLLCIPLNRPQAPPGGQDRRGKLDQAAMLVVHLETDAGVRGLGFAYTIQGGGRAMKAVADDDLAPLVVGQDPLDHERLGQLVYWQTQSVGRRGLMSQAYSAVDVALWDLKAKAAGLPLYKLLGGARESAPVYGSDTGWLWMDAQQIIKASKPYLDQGMMGIKIKVGRPDPEEDAARINEVRDTFGEDVWLGVDANQRYDRETALAMGRFLDEEIGADWFEEPVSCEDVGGHAHLARRLELPLAVGETLDHLDEFEAYLRQDAAGVLQPDVTRVGGITNWLKIAALAERHHRPLAPHVLPELGVHLCCGLPHVRVVEYMPWLYPAFEEPPVIHKGQLVPSSRPGLGLAISKGAVEKYRVA